MNANIPQTSMIEKDQNLKAIRDALVKKDVNKLKVALEEVYSDKTFTEKLNQSTRNFLSQLHDRVDDVKKHPFRRSEYRRDLAFIESELKNIGRLSSDNLTLKDIQEQKQVEVKEYQKRIQHFIKTRGYSPTSVLSRFRKSTNFKKESGK